MRASLLSCIGPALVLSLAACAGDDGDGDGGDCNACDAPNIDSSIFDGPIDASPGPDAMSDAAPPGAINDCTLMSALDRTELADQRVVDFGGTLYTPKSMKIHVGQSVTWSGDFGFHPLRPGLIVNGVRTAQANNPIPPTSNGASVRVTFTTAGQYGYYCDNHWDVGMRGAIFVVQ